MRAEMIEVRVRDEDIQLVEIAFVVCGIDDIRRIAEIVKHQQNPFVPNHKAAVQQISKFHINLILPRSTADFLEVDRI